MNRRKQVLLLQLLCSFLFGALITMFVNTNNTPVETVKDTTETISEEKTVIGIIEYAEELETEAKIQAINEKTIVSAKTKSTPVARVWDFDFASSNKLLYNHTSALLAKIIAIEPRYIMSYYRDILDTKHIEDAVTKRVHHVGVALMKNKRIRYVDNFINEAHTDIVVWEHIRGLDALGSSP